MTNGERDILLAEAQEILQVAGFGLGHYGLRIVYEVFKQGGFARIHFVVSHQELREIFHCVESLGRVQQIGFD